jgi:hypothetical protein
MKYEPLIFCMYKRETWKEHFLYQQRQVVLRTYLSSWYVSLVEITDHLWTSQDLEEGSCSREENFYPFFPLIYF